MAVAQQQSSSHCDSTSGQKCNRPFSRWPKSSLQEPGSRETISLLGLIMSITRQEGLQTTGISSSTSVYRNTDVKKEETHCVQLRPGCLHRFGVQSTQVCIPNLDWESPPPPHIPFNDILSHGGRQSVLTSTPLPEAIPIQKMALSEALWNFLHISLHHPFAGTTPLLHF